MLLARFGLAAGYLSDIADRFGAWGRPGARGVAWGDFPHFVAWVEAWIPSAPLALVMSWILTALEAAFGLGLLIGVRTRTMAFGSGCLLLLLSIITIQLPGGPHALFAQGLLAAAGGSMLLASIADNG